MSKLIFTAVSIIMTAYLLSFSGCSFQVGGGGSPQKKPEVSQEDVKKQVDEHMKKPEVQKTIEDAAKTQRLEDLLYIPEADKLIQDKIAENLGTPSVSTQLNKELTKALGTPEIQKQLQEHIKKAMETPEMSKAINASVQQALMKIIQGGGQGGQGDEQGGGDGSGSGGGQ